MRTVNRQPFSAPEVTHSDMGYKYFHYSQWKGMCDDKNYLGVDQETFADCNNVYIDEEGVLRSRPAIKQLLVDGRLTNIEDAWNFDVVEAYKVLDNGNYKLVFVKDGAVTTTSIVVPKDIILVFADEKIFMFAENRLAYYDILTNIWYDTASTDVTNKNIALDKIYVPVTKITAGGEETELESDNELTTSKIFAYLYDNVYKIDTVKFEGKDVEIIIDDEKYNVTFDSDMLLTFVKPTYTVNSQVLCGKSLGKNADDIPAIEIYSDGTKNIMLITYVEQLEHSFNFSMYISYDMITVTYLDTVDGLHKPFLSKDGTFIVVLKDDGPYALSILAGPSGANEFAIWTNLLKYNKYDAGNQQLNDYSIDVGRNYQVGVALGGVFKDSRNWSYVYGQSANVENLSSDDFAHYRNLVFTMCVNGEAKLRIVNRNSFRRKFTLLDEELRPLREGTTTAMNLHTYSAALYTNVDLTNLKITRNANKVVMTGSLTLLVNGSNVIDNQAITLESSSDSNIFELNKSFNADLSRYTQWTKCSVKITSTIAYDANSVIDAEIIFTTDVVPANDNTDRAAYWNFSPTSILMEMQDDTAVALIAKDNKSDGSRNSRVFYVIRKTDAVEVADILEVDTYVFRDLVFNPILANMTNSAGAVYCNCLYPYEEQTNSDTRAYIKQFVLPWEILKNTVRTGILSENAYTKTDNKSVSLNLSSIIKSYLDKYILTATSVCIKASNTVQPLLSTSNSSYTPLFISDKKIAYLGRSDYKIYTNIGVSKIEVRIKQPGALAIPKFSNFTKLQNYYFTVDNKLMISATGSEQKIEDFKWYLPHINTETFDYEISAVHPISTTEVALFFKHAIYYVVPTEQGYAYYKSRIPLGCELGSEVVTTYDGKYTIFSTERGLVAMSYQDFISSTEQSLTYLSDTIFGKYSVWNVGAIKLTQFKFWLIVYRKDSTEAFVFDLRNNSWWPVSARDYITKVFTADRKLRLIASNTIMYLDTGDEEYRDTNGNIEWILTSQKLHFNAVAYYKHITNITFNALSTRSDETSFFLDVINYSDRTLLGVDKTVNYRVDLIKTYVKRLNYWKSNEFVFELSSDNDIDQIPLSLTNISIKYKLTGEVR